MFKKKIKPSKEMIEQSELWKTEEEDLEKVEKLYLEIINLAKEKGFKGVYEIDCVNGECICYVFDNEKEKNDYFNGEIDECIMVGYPLALIRELEQIINYRSDKI